MIQDCLAQVSTIHGFCADLLRERGLEAVSDAGELEAIARRVVDENAGQANKYRAGETKPLNFFIGQVMKQPRGKADPATLRAVFERLLS